MSDDHRERVRERAYRLWEEAGRPPDQAIDHWIEAERQIEREASSSGAEAGRSESAAARPPKRKAKKEKDALDVSATSQGLGEHQAHRQS